MKKILSPQAVEGLLAWYDENKRDLPWRRTQDPYRIWISEIMLQQTRVEAVKPYYARFLEACPRIEDLALLPEDRLMKLWEGLGYYSRARNLQKAARLVMELYGGKMPDSYEKLRNLPGVGEYTAGAVASIAYGEPVPAVDGNVLRVLARVSGSYGDITRQEVKNAHRQAIFAVIPDKRAGDFNQALIELGATVCVPNGEARCGECPLAAECVARREGKQRELPVKAAKKARRIEKKTVLIIRDGDRTALCKRPDKGLLAGLFELPNLEGHLTAEQLPTRIRALGFEPLHVERLEDSKHIFTHIEWHMVAFSVRIAPEFDGWHPASGMLLVPNRELHEDYAVPSAFSAYVKYL